MVNISLCRVASDLADVVHIKRSKAIYGAVFVSWLKSSVLTVVMSAVVAYLLQLEFFHTSSWEGSLQTLAIIVPAATLIYGCGALLLRMPEFKWALGLKSEKV